MTLSIVNDPIYFRENRFPGEIIYRRRIMDSIVDEYAMRKYKNGRKQTGIRNIKHKILNKYKNAILSVLRY